MNRTEFLEYIIINFNVGGAAGRLIDNALLYAESRFEDINDRHICLTDLLAGIGLTAEEIQLYQG